MLTVDWTLFPSEDVAIAAITSEPAFLRQVLT
jgi:hypothetical protein